MCCCTQRVNDIDLHIDICVHENLNLFGRTSLHLFCHMRVSVQRECGTIVAEHAGDRFCIYAALNC